ncbi:helix-turn-helix domain-containing protein [Faecalibacterium sp. BCRC 81149]
MQARDMNLCVLAKKCGISYSTIQTTARRGGQLSVETIERICLGLLWFPIAAAVHRRF